MNLMPVSDQGKHEQHYGNHEQPRRFRGIHRMAMMPVLGFVLLMWSGHGNIVDAPRVRCRRCACYLRANSLRCRL
jgi:hypothetical protein